MTREIFHIEGKSRARGTRARKKARERVRARERAWNKSRTGAGVVLRSQTLYSTAMRRQAGARA